MQGYQNQKNKQTKSGLIWECRAPKMWTFWIQKVDFLNLTPLTLLQTPHFFAHFVAKSGQVFVRLGGASYPSGYRPE